MPTSVVSVFNSLWLWTYSFMRLSSIFLFWFSSCPCHLSSCHCPPYLLSSAIIVPVIHFLVLFVPVLWMGLSLLSPSLLFVLHVSIMSFPSLLPLSYIYLAILFSSSVSVVTLPCRLLGSRLYPPFSLSFISLNVPCHGTPSPCPCPLSPVFLVLLLHVPFLQISFLHVTIFHIHELHIPSSLFQPSNSCVFTISLSSSLSVMHVPQPCSCSLSLVPLFFTLVPCPWARIFKLLRSPRIDSKESIPQAYVA